MALRGRTRWHDDAAPEEESIPSAAADERRAQAAALRRIIERRSRLSGNALGGPVDYEGPIRFGDRVRVRDAEVTRQRGLVGRTGMVFGETTPSVTGVGVIGLPGRDFALNVQLDDDSGGDNLWFAAALLELLDHAPGTEVQVGDVKLVREPDGQWRRITAQDALARRRPWWRFW